MMNPVLEKLLVLQDRDARLLRLNLEKERLPLERQELDRQEKEALQATEEAKNTTRHIESDRKKLELEAESKETLIRKYKTQLLEIKNNDQFHALQHEIAAAEAEIRRIEDVELELMEKMEHAQAAVKAAELHSRNAVQRIQTQRREMEGKAAILDKQIGELQTERAALVGGFEEDLLSRYERIFKNKQGQAVVRVSHGLCTGCHLKLTAQEVNDAMQEDALVSCTNCGRILYWHPE